MFPMIPVPKAYNCKKITGNKGYTPWDPWKMWYEARWILVRRLFGQVLIQKIFFRVISSIWEENNENPPGVRRLVVEEVFGGKLWDFPKDT